MKSLFALLSFLTLSAFSAPNAEPLFPNGAPGSHGTGPLHEPTLTWYPAPKENNTGVTIVVFPGGGYGAVCTSTEGTPIAEWCNTWGASAAVINYRMSAGGYRHPYPLMDAQRAIRTVRSRAAQYGIDPGKIGVIGFSAGGHLVSTTLTHFDAGKADSADPVERVSSRPDFGILCYPVIMFDSSCTHRGSQENLLGKNPDPALVDSLSSEKQVTPQTPPVFIVQTDDDTVVPAENAVNFYLACRKNKVPAEMHIFKPYQHGIALGVGREGASMWPELCKSWLRNMKILNDKK